MFWIMIIIVVVASILGDSYSKHLKHKEKTLKIQQDMLIKQIELEQLKNETFKLETEKLRLELSEDFKNAPSKDQLLEYKTKEEI
ncbi:MAG: hypothetical protein KBT36_14005 [Kurthia sp.]|nr:hypothetical protein [Candidatus Kurthia equi]